MSFSDLVMAADRAAASIFHVVAAKGVKVAQWASSPEIAPIVADAVALTNDTLKRAGSTVTVTDADVHAGLQAIAGPHMMAERATQVLAAHSQALADNGPAALALRATPAKGAA